MYQLDWIQRRRSAGAPPRAPVNPVVWKLGFTSMLTDISSEMVSCVLPIYLTLHLHLSAMQYGAIDGIYNGVAVALLSIAGGILADRTRRPREVAAAGYGLSALCKLLMLAAGATWGWIAGVILLDRAGKGVRTAPRDAIISLSNPKESLAGAFAVHRALDAGGALLGPIAAFTLLSLNPADFRSIWMVSFVFALLGLAVLWLFVENPARTGEAAAAAFAWQKLPAQLAGRGFWPLAAVGTLLSMMTVSDGFLYLLLQRQSSLPANLFPLLSVVTACSYMIFAIPVGRAADRYGRLRFLVLGYGAVGLIYVLLLSPLTSGLYGSLGCLLLLGLYYAATDGVLLSLASAVIPAECRTSGIAVLATLIGLGKLGSSLCFGWLTHTYGSQTALLTLGIGLAGTLLIALRWLRRPHASPAT